MYKDKDRQREADKERQRRYRAERGRKAYPKGVTDLGCDKEGVTEVERDEAIEFMAAEAGKAERTAQGNIRVSKPGDADYEPQCETTRAFIDGNPKTSDILKHIGIQPDKRGKDIKSFEDLPPDVQKDIAMMSRHDGKIDPIVKANRTERAIHYQHVFPDRFHSTGVA